MSGFARGILPPCGERAGLCEVVRGDVVSVGGVGMSLIGPGDGSRIDVDGGVRLLALPGPRDHTPLASITQH